MIDTIFFDLMGVLLFPKGNFEAGELADEIDRQIGKVTNDVLFKEETLHRYQLRDDEFSQLLQTIADKYEPYIPLWELLPRLKKHYKLGIINNGTYLTYPLFEERYHLSQRFDVFISSALEGICKPDPAIYRLACQKLGSQPLNCLFMDDSAENIMGAQQAGVQTIHWSSKEQGFQEFEKYIHHVTKAANTASQTNEPITSETR
ncbi:FMN hydrolase / 5-amino-6-(5-phospho-D-ribitylamino)uracil phosphatase [Thermoflexales bacterium]|nr:FMN hydrolase / 5-amino-6-(5-phospho-D-ribitylamino)uracil phosphatase [Thermoflexales bacterium]